MHDLSVVLKLNQELSFCHKLYYYMHNTIVFFFNGLFLLSFVYDLLLLYSIITYYYNK